MTELSSAHQGETDSRARERRAEAFLDPVGFILEEHYRQRDLCDELEALAAELETAPVAGPVADWAARLAVFLKEDLRLHLEDEERDFFPLLRTCCIPEDEVEDILDLLSEEHGLDEDLASFLLEDLETLASGHKLANPTRFLVNVREFATTQRRHLAWENALLLPVAKRRIKDSDRIELGRRMAARRGLPPPA